MNNDRHVTMDRDIAEIRLAHGSDDDIRETLVSISLNDADRAWVQEKLIRFASHPSWSVRAVAATCFGHLARIHGALDLGEVLVCMKALLDDPLTADYARNAMNDIRRYVRE